MTVIAKNTLTGQTRTVTVSLKWLKDVTFEVHHDVCTGSCKHNLEPGGVCPKGWPSRSRAAGII